MSTTDSGINLADPKTERASPGFLLFLAPAVKGGEGLTLGLYILTYSAIAQAVLSSWPPLKDFSGELDFGTLYVAAMLVCEWGLQLFCGAIADRIRMRDSLLLSLGFRACFFACLALATYLSSHPTMAVMPVLLSIICFSISYSLFGSNYDVWLRSSIPDARLASRIFAVSAAVRSLMIIVGGIIALMFLALARAKGQDTIDPSKIAKNALGHLESYAPFLLAFLVTLVVGFLSLWIKNQIQNPGISLKEAIDHGRKELSGRPYLQKLFLVMSFYYGQLQLMSVLLPLVLIFGEDLLINKALILVVASYGPGFVGSLLAALKAGGHLSSGTGDDTGLLQKRRSASFRGIGASILLGLLAPFLFSSKIDPHLRSLSMAVIVAGWRILYSFMDPRLQFLAADAAKKSKYPKVLLSFSERYKKIAALVILFLPTMIMLAFDVSLDKARQLTVLTVAGASGLAFAWLAFETATAEASD